MSDDDDAPVMDSTDLDPASDPALATRDGDQQLPSPTLPATTHAPVLDSPPLLVPGRPSRNRRPPQCQRTSSWRVLPVTYHLIAPISTPLPDPTPPRLYTCISA